MAFSFEIIYSPKVTFKRLHGFVTFVSRGEDIFLVSQRKCWSIFLFLTYASSTRSDYLPILVHIYIQVGGGLLI